MVRTGRLVLTVLAVAMMVSAAWVSMPVRTALACSGNETDFVAGSTSVVLGTVVFVGEMVVLPPRTSKSDPAPSPNNDRMTPVRIEVSRTLMGAEQVGTIEVYAAIRDPENEGNLPCFPLEREAVLGSEAVIALRADSNGTMQFSGPQYWAVDQPAEPRTREVLQSVYNGKYPGIPATGSGLSPSAGNPSATVQVAGGLLMLVGGALWLSTMRRRVR